MAVAPEKSAERRKIVRTFSTDGEGGEVRLGPLTGAEAFGNGIALATEDGLFRLCPVPGSRAGSLEYALLDPAALLPEIEFCMVRSDLEEFAEGIGDLPGCRLGIALDSGEKAVAETWLSGGMRQESLPESLRKRVEERIADIFSSFRSAAVGRNLFICPFMVMYTLVDKDGGRLAVSPPVVMLPSSGYPMLRLDRGSVSESMAVFETTFLSRPCRLALRVTEMPDATRLSGVAAGVEIYVTVPDSVFSPGPLRRRVCSLFTHSSATLFGDDCGEELLDN